jgi:ribosomal protein S12 methylthiotransferase
VEKHPTVRLLTLGCGRNDVDSEELAARLTTDGWQIVAEGPFADGDNAAEMESPDVILVNTCGFIESAKAESVETIMDGSSGHSKVIAVGCLAERYGQELAEQLPEADAVIGFDGYEDISNSLRRVVAGESIASHKPRDRRNLIPIAPVHRSGESTPPGHAAQSELNSTIGSLPSSGTRVLRHRLNSGPVAPLKIASGCDRRCAFCAIPRFRGAFVSRRPEEILTEAQWLADRGVREAVLVSENSTSYGKDLGDPRLLEHLLVELSRVLPRVRVSYLQPAETRPSLIESIASVENVADYFDMSFQHASGKVLRRMRRFGDGESFLAMVDKIRMAAPEAGVRSNVIVGFPGESEDDVSELIDFLHAARLDAVGVFGYSDEEDTEADLMGEKIDPDEVAARVAEVNVAVEHSCQERAVQRIGTEVTVMVESSANGVVQGRAEHQGPEDSETSWRGSATVGDFARVEVIDVEGVDLVASSVRSESGGRSHD